MALEAPHKKVLVGREVWDLYADHRAWNFIELTTKRSYRHWIRRLLRSRSTYRMEPLYLFLWAFSARHRAKQNVCMSPSLEDRTLKSYYPSEFLDMLAQGLDDVTELRNVVLEMLAEAGLVELYAAPDEGQSAPEEGENPTLTPDLSTGTGEH